MKTKKIYNDELSRRSKLLQLCPKSIESVALG